MNLFLFQKLDLFPMDFFHTPEFFYCISGVSNTYAATQYQKVEISRCYFHCMRLTLVIFTLCTSFCFQFSHISYLPHSFAWTKWLSYSEGCIQSKLYIFFDISCLVYRTSENASAGFFLPKNIGLNKTLVEVFLCHFSLFYSECKIHCLQSNIAVESEVGI